MLLTKSTQVPEAVVNSSDPSTMLWMANLSQENGRSHLCHTVAETEDESASHIHWQNISPLLYKYMHFQGVQLCRIARTSITIGKGSNKPAQDHQETTNCDWDLASPPIGHVRAMSESVEKVSNRLSEEGLHQRETAKTSNLIDSIHQSESITSWRSEIMLPGIETLGCVKHHAVIERVC